jgi:hypothetical protein
MWKGTGLDWTGLDSGGGGGGDYGLPVWILDKGCDDQETITADLSGSDGGLIVDYRRRVTKITGVRPL